MSTVIDLLRRDQQDLYVSASALKTLDACGRQYWYHYVQGVPAEDVPARMVLGSAIHKALSIAYHHLRDGEPVPVLNTLVSVAGAAITAAVASTPAVHFDAGSGPGELVEEATRLLTAWAEQGYRPARVIAVEVPFNLPLMHPETGEVLPFEEHVVGALDLVVAEDNGTVVVVDHKITSRLDRQKTEQPDLQMSIYAWAAEQMFNVDKVGLRYQDIVRTKTAKVEVQEVVRIPHDEAEGIEAVASGLEVLHLALSHPKGKRLMGRRRSWRCKECGWRRHCAEDRT